MSLNASSVRIAVIGAGPAGLALALLAARALPAACISVYDARPAARDVSTDPRALALSLGSVQLLQRLGTWPASQAEPILAVDVSQAPPTLPDRWGSAAVRITAQEQRVPMLGAVLTYGSLVGALQQAWEVAVAAEPSRLVSRFGAAVSGLSHRAGGVRVETADGADDVDLAVVAEGGVFADQARKGVSHDYRQTAWVGSVTLDGAPRGMAFERFTRQGPLALLPLPSADGRQRAAMVWCVDAGDDPVRDLDDNQRLLVMASLLPDGAGRVCAISPLKSFGLGLNAERTLVDGRIVRIGNAAQTLHPVAGQGLNLGLRDGHDLVAALARRRDVGGVLRSLEWQRGPDRWAMIAATDFLARSFTWQLPGAGTARGLGLAALQAWRPARSALARQMMYGLR
jgi:2-octaprenyl-6-methoxyphenol hydroxylase